MLVLSRAEVARITGTTTSQLGALQQDGVIPSSGQMTQVQTLAIAVARGLADRGCPMAHAGEVLQYLWQMSEEELIGSFKRGAKYIIVIGTRPVPRLVSRHAVTRNDAIPAGVAYCAGLVPALIDVRRVWDRIAVVVTELRRQQTPPDTGNNRPRSGQHEPADV